MNFLWLLAAQARVALLSGMQYRADFVVQLVLSVFWTAGALVPLVAVYHQQSDIGGWGWHEALLVVGFFTILKGVVEMAIEPSMVTTVEQIRTGKFDATMLLPADTQVLASTTQVRIWYGGNVLVGMAVIGYALWHAELWPSALEVAAATLLLIGGTVVMFSIQGLMLSLAFFVVKVDNLVYLFLSLFEAARWPASVYRGALAVVFTFVLPIVVMTSYPAMALRGMLGASELAIALVVCSGFALLSRLSFQRAIKAYVGAGG